MYIDQRTRCDIVMGSNVCEGMISMSSWSTSGMKMVATMSDEISGDSSFSVETVTELLEDGTVELPGVMDACGPETLAEDDATVDCVDVSTVDDGRVASGAAGDCGCEVDKDDREGWGEDEEEARFRGDRLPARGLDWPIVSHG